MASFCGGFIRPKLTSRSFRTAAFKFLMRERALSYSPSLMAALISSTSAMCSSTRSWLRNWRVGSPGPYHDCSRSSTTSLSLMVIALSWLSGGMLSRMAEQLRGSWAE